MHTITKCKLKYLYVRWIIVILLSAHFLKTNMNLISTLNVFFLMSSSGLNVSKSLHISSRFAFCLKFWGGGIHDHVLTDRRMRTKTSHNYHHHHLDYQHVHYTAIAGSQKVMNRHGLPVIIPAALSNGTTPDV